MLDIYEKLTPIVGSKGGVKEEVIEDVEMEDAMFSSNSKHSSRFEGKKEPSDRSVSKATPQRQVPGSSVKGEVKTEHSEESIPVRSAKDVKVESKEVAGDNTTKPQEGEQSNQKPHSDDSTSSKQEVNSSDSDPSKQDSVKQEESSSSVSKSDGEKKSEQDTK